MNNDMLKALGSMVLLAALALMTFMLLPSDAWGQTYDSLGWYIASQFDTHVGGGDSTPVWNFQDIEDSNLVYTAGANDSVYKVHYYGGRSGMEIQLGIYEWAASAPTDSFRTTVVTTDQVGWDSAAISPAWKLEDGQKYTYATCEYDTLGHYNDGVWNPAGDDVKLQEGVDGLPASYSTNDFWSGPLSGWFDIAQYGAAEVIKPKRKRSN